MIRMIDLLFSETIWVGNDECSILTKLVLGENHRWIDAEKTSADLAYWDS